MELKQNPIYPKIALKDITPASILVFYGGPKITEYFGNEVYKFPYKPAPFHLSVYLERGLHCNVGVFTTIEQVDHEFRSTRRIDVITFPYMNTEQRYKVLNYEYKRAGANSSRFRFYDLKGFLYAGLRKVPLLNKVLKPSRRHDFCSDNVADAFGKAPQKVSDKPDEETYPWDPVQWAWDNPEVASLYTLWIGNDFKP